MIDTQAEIHAEPRALADGFRGTDIGNSARLIAVANGRIRYVHEWGKCIVYREGVWMLDADRVLAITLAKQVCRAMFAFAVRPEVGEKGRDDLIAWAKQSENGTRIREMIRHTFDESGVHIEHRELDQRHEYLNALNGTIDLRTGVLRPHDPDDLITKQIEVIYDPTARAPRWERYLAEWQPDLEMRTYLQEKIGAAATGYAPEEFDIHYGEGGNGKGKFFNGVTNVLGPYANQPHKSLIVKQDGTQHETIIADLFGVRLAVFAETDRDVRLDEERVKELSGNDHQLRGRRMREDRWSFWPTHSLMVHTNHKPIIMDTTESIWRRVRLIPWDVTIPLKDQDPTLPQQLHAEASGILNWIVAGAGRWLANDQRFTVPTKVVNESERYHADADPLYRCFNALTVNGEESFATAESLHELFMAWRSEESWHDEVPPFVTKTALGAYLKRRYRPGKRGGVRGWFGIGINPQAGTWLDGLRQTSPERLRPTMRDTVAEASKRS